MKKNILTVLAVITVLTMLTGTASACTSIYVGSSLSADGSTIFGRSEDYSNSQNKLFYVSPAGNHTAGEEFSGCYGFTWTFTHDSYGYTAFSDDNGEGVGFVCPDCGGTHKHTPYEAAGTNDQGLSVSATETIGGLEQIEDIDPYEDAGIEEAELVTVVLSEAATAKQALELLTGIYDTQGANNGSGLFLADSTETWYIENVSGHQYIAVKLPDTLVMAQPNMSVIGLIDLDDTENVVASAGIIETAKAAGTYVGSEEDNTINYVVSYCGGTSPNARMVNALQYLDTAYEGKTAEEIDGSAYVLSNVDADGNITTLYNGIKPAAPLTIADVQNFYHISNIGYVRNLETHIFQISDDSPTGTIEWVAMNDTSLGVLIPYYPLLTKNVYEGYKLSTPEAEFVTEEPAEGLYYATTINQRINGERVAVDGFMVLPDNWADSVYWTQDAFSNLLKYGGFDEDTLAQAQDVVYTFQAEANSAFDEFAASFDAGAEDASDQATAFSMALAESVHEQFILMVNSLIGAE